MATYVYQLQQLDKNDKAAQIRETSSVGLFRSHDASIQIEGTSNLALFPDQEDTVSGEY